MPETSDARQDAPVVDVLIAGGGPIGSAIALALAGSSLRVALIGPAAPDSGDPRPIALSHGSRSILEQLGCWPLALPGATAISAIHISQRGRFGRTLINAAEHQLPALGYVIAYDALHRAVSSGLGCTRITGLVDAIEDRGTYARAISSTGVIDARLIVLADGGHIAGSHNEDYGQVALVARVTADKAHQGRAWERFTPEGPLALLPFDKDKQGKDAAGSHCGDNNDDRGGNDGGYAMVWCTTPERALELAEANEQRFLAALQHTFGHRAGRFTAGTPCVAFPLALRRAKRSPPHCVLVGNAAQALHPVAGQGLNLGLRDGLELARLIRNCAAQDLGTPAFDARYQRARASDRSAVLGLTDTLVKLFSNSNPAAGLARGAGLFLLDLLPAPRRFFTRRMMYGMRGLP